MSRSGKKYKKCCYAADLERLADFSDVEGVTVRELEEAPEAHLTAERIRQMRSYEVYRLDPEKVAPELLPKVIQRLSDFSEFERICEIVQGLAEIPPSLSPWLHEVIYEAETKRRPDIVRRLMELHPPIAKDLAFGTGFALCEEAGELLDKIEASARRCVATEEALVDEVEMAHAMLRSPYPGMGILLGRAALATAAPWNGDALIESIEEVRDELALAAVSGGVPAWQQREVPRSGPAGRHHPGRRLAAGEPSAIQGVRPLKMLPHIFRQKVAADYRLFFELGDGEVQVVDLIHRRDLDKWIKARR